MHRYIGTHMSMQIHFHAFTFLMYTYTYIQHFCAQMHTSMQTDNHTSVDRCRCVLTIEPGHTFFVWIGYTHFGIFIYTWIQKCTYIHTYIQTIVHVQTNAYRTHRRARGSCECWDRAPRQHRVSGTRCMRWTSWARYKWRAGGKWRRKTGNLPCSFFAWTKHFSRVSLWQFQKCFRYVCTFACA